MRIHQIALEGASQLKLNKMIYNLKHYASLDTIEHLLKIAHLMPIHGEEDDQQHQGSTVNSQVEEDVPGGSLADRLRKLKELTDALNSLAHGTPEQIAHFEKMYTEHNFKTIEDLVDDVIKARRLPSEYGDTISGWFRKASGTYEQKIEFLRDIRYNGYLETSALLSPEPSNFNSIAKYSSVVYDGVKDKFMSFEGKISGISIGKGELFCIFFASNVFKGSRGDLVIQGRDAEVKAIRSRFMATTGYGSTSSFFKTYKKMLQDLVPSMKDELEKKDRNWYNWNYSGLTNLRDIFINSRNPEECKRIIDKTLDALYLESTPEQRSRVSDVISNDGSFDVNSFLHAWVLMQFEYYKSVDGFDGILFLNPTNFNFVYIEDSSELDANWDLFRINPSLSWKEVRNVTSQVTLM